MPDAIAADVSIRRVTHPPGCYFFGYYDKTPWSPDGAALLGMRAAFEDRQPRPDDVVELGLIDPSGGAPFRTFARTSAWCWQQGTMLQWLPGAGNTVVYNARRGYDFVGVVHDLDSDRTRELERAVYALDPQGRYAVGLNFARLAVQRPGYGYAGGRDPWCGDDAPTHDGVWMIDVRRGRARLALSLAEIASLDPDPSLAGCTQWLNHAQIAPDGSRLAVLHRWAPARGGRRTRLVTANPDGSDARVAWRARHVSHYDWRSADELLVWGGAPVAANAFWLLGGGAAPIQFAGETLTEDGHCSFSPDRAWVACDTYPDAQGLRRLMIVRAADGLRVDLAAFHAPARFDGPLRVDLHPRWNRSGSALCVDSAHEGTRQIYVVDVRSALHAGRAVPIGGRAAAQ